MCRPVFGLELLFRGSVRDIVGVGNSFSLRGTDRFLELGDEISTKSHGSGEASRGGEKASAVKQEHLPENGRRKALCYDWTRESSRGMPDVALIAWVQCCVGGSSCPTLCEVLGRRIGIPVSLGGTAKSVSFFRHYEDSARQALPV